MIPGLSYYFVVVREVPWARFLKQGRREAISTSTCDSVCTSLILVAGQNVVAVTLSSYDSAFTASFSPFPFLVLSRSGYTKAGHDIHFEFEGSKLVVDLLSIASSPL